ncbi:MAG: NAD(P)H-binding protein [Gemmatimonadaceae bacterium]
MSTQRSVLVLGASGLVGRALVSYLLREQSILSVTALVRRDTQFPIDPKLRVIRVDFDQLDRYAGAFRVDQVFCALGTTMRQAGSRDRFRVVDHDYPVSTAKLAYAQSARHYLLVSALGANTSSRVFYNRVKGETEEDIRRVGFQSVTIARPSLLTGPREELRLGERVGHALGRLLPPRLRPIPASDVAAALTLAARESRHGVEILRSARMRGASLQLSKT